MIHVMLMLEDYYNTPYGSILTTEDLGELSVVEVKNIISLYNSNS